MTENQQKICTMLADISLAMSDAYHFIKLREVVLDWERMAEEGNTNAAEAIENIRWFQLVCEQVEKMK